MYIVPILDNFVFFYIFYIPQRVFEEDEAEEATKKSSSKCCSGYTYFVQLNYLWKVEFLSQSISKYRNRTTTLLPFLQAINHFCTFIHSYFMDRFALLIEGTSYTIFTSEVYHISIRGIPYLH